MERELNKRGFFHHDWHIRVPKIVRFVAVIVLVAGLFFVGISYYRSRRNKPFRLRPGNPQLSTQVVGILEGYERRETKGDREWLLLRAARDVTYSDGHHELEDPYLEVYRKNGDKPDTIKARRSLTDDQNNRIWFYGNVNMLTHDGLSVQTEELNYDRQNDAGETDKPVKFNRENVDGHAATARYDGKQKNFVLNGNVEINVVPKKPDKTSPAEWKESTRSRPVKITAPTANFDQNLMTIAFTGGATAEQERDVISGDTLTAYLNEQKKVKQIATRGKSYMRTMEEGHAAELNATDVDFFFDADQRLQQVNATTAVNARSLNADSDVAINNANTLKTTFQAEGDRSVIKEMLADGRLPDDRLIVTMSAPKSRASDPRASSKKLTADNVRLVWHTNGLDLEHVEAIGSAELIIEPVVKTPVAERRILVGPRFDVEFFESGNLARQFTAIDNPKLTLEPLVPTPKHQTRTLNSQKMVSLFIKETQDIDRVDCIGQVKYNEADRHAQSDTALYT
ncbi:MAG: LPS export ABC transporter periplasmic protein LptC, partial [Pyrinomonadaceae bacterium]